MLQQDSPHDGDVLIRSLGNSHFLSIVPHPDRLSFANFERALLIARAVAATAAGAEVWCARGSQLRKLPPDADARTPTNS